MRRLIITAALLATATVAPAIGAEAASCDNQTNNTYKKLLACASLEGAREHQAAFQAIADDNNDIRTSGTPGYDQSAAYVADRMTAAGYDVTVQEFTFESFIQLGPSTLEQIAPLPTSYIEGTDYNLMSQTEAGDVTGPVTAVDLALGAPATSTSGCEPGDFAGFPVGSIALVQRGACSFQLKAENAAAAGAIGTIIFNQGNSPDRTGLINGTLSANYVGGIPVFFATFDRGVEWASTSGLVLRMVADTFRGEATTSNVFAETRTGNPNNVVMVGAHLDSVNAGPGIQDNGSGSAAILEVAEAMAKTKPVNKVRFAWWGAEESGLVGSNYYINNLPEAERDKIALYLNFDMIGSPNHVFFVYDGDDSDGVGAGPGPEGSAHIEQVFEAYYQGVGKPYKGTDFSGRSDYGPFIAVGIPSGGLFTGAEGIKTAEEAAIWGGTAGDQYDPCYHLACDTFDNINLGAFDVNVDAVAFATLTYAMSTEGVNGAKGHPAGNPFPGSTNNSTGYPGGGEQGGLHDDDHELATS